MTYESDDAETRTGRRILACSLVGGAALGAAFGIPRYGVFSMSNVAMIGLGMILVVAIAAAVIAAMPPRAVPPADDRPSR